MGARGVARAAAILLLLLACLPCWGVARLTGNTDFWARLFLRQTGRILGLRTRIAGQPATGPVLYVANHLSWLDILAIGGATGARFIAKSEIAGWSLVGWLATAGGSVYVSRERRSATREQADQVADALGGSRPVVLFAEGGTGDGVTLTPFRPALFAAAVEAGAKVQPLAVDYGTRAAEIAWPEGTRFSTEMKRILGRGGTIPVTLRFAGPLDATTLDRKTLATTSHAAVARALELNLFTEVRGRMRR